MMSGYEGVWEWHCAVRFGQYAIQYISLETKMSSIENSDGNEISEGRWAEDEHHRFLRGIMLHGKDWKNVEKVVLTRTGSQVRSHAQKFFIKLGKIAKERKKCKNKQLMEPSEIQRQILNHFSTKDITSDTPPEIAALIQKDWEAVAASYSQKKKQAKANKNTPRVRADSSPEVSDEERQDIFGGEVKMSEQGCEDSNEESFFMKIMYLPILCSKMNKQHFKNGCSFLELVDFGKNTHQQTQSTSFGKRKRSFSLFHEEENSGKLKETLDSLHKAMGIEE